MQTIFMNAPCEAVFSARTMLVARRSPDCAERNPWPVIHCGPGPGLAPRNPGYGPGRALPGNNV